ncbi:MAG: diguanylate cyclase [Chloroflexi bacterium]|nr:diguanylate cyclase [Chloroflexota bacterium]
MPKQDAMTKQQLMNELEQLRDQVLQFKKLEKELMTTEQVLRCAEEQWRRLFEDAQHGILVLDAETGQVKEANPHFLAMLGYSKGEVIGKNLFDLDCFIDVEKNKAAFKELKVKGHCHLDNVPLETRTGLRLDIEIDSKVCAVTDNKIIHCNFHDNTERNSNEREIRLIATHDSLTGLPNRILFLDRAHIAVLHAQRRKKMVALVSLDLDKFSSVNETLGNDLGNKLLKAVAERFTGLLRKSDTIARVGGDEFAMVLPELEHMEDVIKIADKLVDAFRQQFMVNGRRVIVTISAGVAVYPADGKDPETLLNCADKLMYNVRSQGSNSYKMSQMITP